MDIFKRIKIFIQNKKNKVIQLKEHKKQALNLPQIAIEFSERPTILLDERNKLFFVGSSNIKLTENQVEVLSLLLQNKNKLITYQEFTEKANISNRVLHIAVDSLNKKIKKYIHIEERKRIGMILEV